MTLRAKLRWIFLLYFVEGFPFGFFYDALPVYLRMHGLSLAAIGAVSLLQLPWTLKVLWSPLVDRLGTPRRWIVGALLVLAATHAAIPWFDARAPSVWFWVLLAILTIASATQDIAIDGAFVHIVDKGEEGPGNGIRISAYRSAMIVSGGGLVMLGGVVAWPWVFACAAALLLGFAVAVPFAPITARPAHVPLREWWQGFLAWIARPSAGALFAFILLYKLGDVSMGAMVRPFWVDSGMAPEEIGLVTTTFGIVFTVLGALAGGRWIARRGLYASLWQLGITQAASNLGYAVVAFTAAGRYGIYAASVFESFTQGLGSAALLSLGTRSCDRAHAATQMALLTGIFGLTRAVAGFASGWATESLGYAQFFALTFVLSFPAYVLLPWVRSWAREP